MHLVVISILVIVLLLAFIMLNNRHYYEFFNGDNDEKVPMGPIYYDDQTKTIMTGYEMTDPNFEPVNFEKPLATPKNYFLLDDGAEGTLGVHDNMCSKACCSDQYPPPFKLKVDPLVCGNKGDFVPSNLMCNNSWQNSGCLCLTKKQSKFLANRGGNADYY